MRGALASLYARSFFLESGSSSVRKSLRIRVLFSDQEFNALVEAAADFADYRSGRFFVQRKSKSDREKFGALRLRDPFVRPPWAVALRRMLDGLAALEFTSKQGPAFVQLCEAGARYGWQELAAAIAPELRAKLSRTAQKRLTNDLQRRLAGISRECVELERTSFGLAWEALGVRGKTTDAESVDRKFLGSKPSHRLFSIFRKFPVLARLWSESVTNWRHHVTKLLVRFAADQSALSRFLLNARPIGTIIDVRCGLSDPHNGGRTVTMLQFGTGAVIYKPRRGDGEWEWGSLLRRMNAQSFQPKLKAGRVLRRKDYCWMEWIERRPCKTGAAVCGFYQRMGGTIAAAYLLNAVDCHRDNFIASGQYPVLIDADALWHVTSVGKIQTPSSLSRTGFFPSSNRRSLQSRSSVLGGTSAGKHIARIGTRAVTAARYQREIVNGFGIGWRCIIGTKRRHAALVRRLRRIRSRKRRRIYWPTEKYAAIRRASIQPSALRSGIERERLIARLCTRKGVPAAVYHGEIKALKRLDIPYLQEG
jgi:lantibiotic modifying enzyme